MSSLTEEQILHIIAETTARWTAGDTVTEKDINIYKQSKLKQRIAHNILVASSNGKAFP